jgi:hypothetical protein
MPYLTPQELPEGDDCRPLSIPANTEWLALFGGALTELTKVWNWEDSGGLTVAETVAKMQEIIDGWYENACAADCTLPSDTPLFRLGADGHFQELIDGEWTTPSGDYEIPATEPRTEPTADERKCLAAANAVHALDLLYENLADSIASHLDAIDAAASLVAAVVGGIGLVLGAITGGMIETAGFIFASVYAAVEFITADLWDEEFNAKLVCILLSCASEDEDVVHFDFECVMNALRSQTELLDPTLSDLRLFAQLSIMLGWLGAEGLDAAGATTDVEEYDCDGCMLHCHAFDFTETDGDFIPGYPDFAPPAAYISDYASGEGWKPSGSPAIYNGFYLDFDPIEIRGIHVDWSGGSGSADICGSISLQLFLGGSLQATVSTTESFHVTGRLQFEDVTYACDRIVVSGNNCPNTGWAFVYLDVLYVGDPVLGEDNCL